MADASQNGRTPALGSHWSGLSEHLIASFFPVVSSASSDSNSVIWSRDPNGIEVKAPLTDSTVELTMSWQSAFENTGPDQKLSSLSALLQSGYLAEVLASIGARLGSATVRSLADKTKELSGKTNVTKLNSAQVFVGMPPLKLPVTAHFRAWTNARTEVRDPIDQLIQWALPQDLADDGPVGAAIKGHEWLYPSVVPQVIGMKYADTLLMPLVIESISTPLSGQRTRDGTLAYATVTMQLASLAALDATDWRAAKGINFVERRE